MKALITVLVLTLAISARANEIWKDIMPHTAIVTITASNIPKFLNYSTVTLVAKGVTPDGKHVYIFLGTEHSLNRNVTTYTPEGPIDVDEVFGISYMIYDDLGRGTHTAGINETDRNVTFHVDGDTESDVGLLTIIMTKQLHITPSKLICEAVADQLELGQTVYIGSAPCFPYVTFRTGMISLIPNDQIFMVDSGIAAGASGGGVYNEDGKYIGMISASVCGDFLGIVVPMNTIYDFFRTKKLTFPTMCGDDNNVGKDSIRSKQGAGGTSGKTTDSKEFGSNRGGVGSGDRKAAKEEEKEED